MLIDLNLFNFKYCNFIDYIMKSYIEKLIKYLKLYRMRTHKYIKNYY